MLVELAGANVFGLRLITFWQAIDCWLSAGSCSEALVLVAWHRNSRGNRGRIRERVCERMAERWEQMTPEERDEFRHRRRGRGGQTTPLDSNRVRNFEARPKAVMK